jgi:hypothetical protein
MATDYALMIENLLSFYDFNDKSMIAIGAGGGQFVAYGRAPRSRERRGHERPAARQDGRSEGHALRLQTDDGRRVQFSG